MRKINILIILGVVVVCLLLVGQNISAEESYPEKPITIVVPWSVGGVTDLTVRSIQPILQEILDVPVVVNNMPGGSSAVGSEFVANAKPDGYTLLFATNELAIFQVMGLSDLSFDDFNPIMILTMGLPSFCVHADSQWETIEEFLEDAKKRPGEILAAHSGLGASSHINAMMLGAAGIEMKLVGYNGGGPAVTAVLQKEADVTFQLFTEVTEYIASGDLRLLTTFTNERTDFYPDVPALGEVLPEIKSFLPWGIFNSPCTPKGTPDEVNEVLEKAFIEAIKDPRWIKTVTENVKALNLGYTGEAAIDFINKWRSTTGWMLYEGGLAKTSPADFDIPKP